MKQKAKAKSIPNAKKRATSRSQDDVVLLHPKKPLLKHLKLVHHKHTGKLIHHRNTSHSLLMLILILIGLFLYASDSYVQSYTGDSVVVGAVVAGPPPAKGATITYPADEAEFDDAMIDVKGVCDKNSFVIVRDNNIMAGSVACSEAGVYSLSIQLQRGQNVLSALNYDNLNQVGPATGSITVYLRQNGQKVTTMISAATSPTLQALSANPTKISGIDSGFDCNNYQIGALPADDEPHITIACAPRLFLPQLAQVMGVIAWGGTPPYAISVDMGNSSNDLISLPSAGYKTLSFSYAAPNIYKISFKLKDQSGKTAAIQTSVQVSGVVSSNNTDAAKTSSGGDRLISTISKVPLPLYLVALAVTIGFWGGDLFARKYGSKPQKGRRKIA